MVKNQKKKILLACVLSSTVGIEFQTLLKTGIEKV